jgi:hypothetical protein
MFTLRIRRIQAIIEQYGLLLPKSFFPAMPQARTLGVVQMRYTRQQVNFYVTVLHYRLHHLHGPFNFSPAGHKQIILTQYNANSRLRMTLKAAGIEIAGYAHGVYLHF